MNKISLIYKYFDRSGQLTTTKKSYCSSLSSFFLWLTDNDGVHNDQTTKVLGLKNRQIAQIIAGEDGIIAGLEEINYLLEKHTSLILKTDLKDGQQIKKDRVIAEIKGNTSEILAFERTILNILQRMSGIATETYKLNYELRIKNYGIYITATRKTPWMVLDKKAVSVGGGLTHRLSLSDGILIKDNHLSALKREYQLKSTEEAIKKALEIINKAIKTPPRWRGNDLDSWDGGGKTMTSRAAGIAFGDARPMVKEPGLIEIEVGNEKQAISAVKVSQRFLTNNLQPTTYNILAIMLDNFSPLQAKKALVQVKKMYDCSRIIFEASGGINEENILEWAETGVDIISLGSLTHSARALDISMKF